MTDFLRRQYWLLRIWGMRILDREYFEILAARSFRSDLQAIAFYLRHETDAVLALALSPLVEAEWLARSVADPTASWYVALLRARDLVSTSPVFDAASYAQSIPSRRRPRRALRALRQFLASVSASTTMPVTPDVVGPPPTWSAFREESLRLARAYAAQRDARRPRTTDQWDSKLERAFLAGLPVDSQGGETLISVVMATRNRNATVGSAIASVREQSHANWELLVVDDGSTDGTRETVSALAAADPRIRLLSQAAEGVSIARNRGLAEARGELLAFLDSDNSWRRDFLQASIAGLRQVDAEFVYSAMRLHEDKGIVRYRALAGSMATLLSAGNYLDLNSVVMRRSLFERVGAFDPSIARWVDYDLFLRISGLTEAVYLPFLGVDYDNGPATDRISVDRSPSWEDVVLGKHLIDWEALERSLSTRVSGSVSVVIPTYGDWRLTAEAVRSVLECSSGDALPERRVEIVVVDNGSPRQVSAILSQLFAGSGRVVVHRVARNLNFALGSNLGVMLSHGEYLIMLNNDARVTDGWLDPLLEPLSAERAVIATQPLLLYPDGSVQSAGTVFVGDSGIPRHFLAGHTVGTALAAPAADYSAITAAAMCIRASDFVALRGFDPIFTNGLEDVDLCLRAHRSRPGSLFRVVRSSRVVHHEGQTPGRGRAVSRNRELFAERWDGSFPASDDWRYDAMGLPVPTD